MAIGVSPVGHLMGNSLKRDLVLLLLLPCLAGAATAQKLIAGKQLPMPPTWEDRETGHQVFRLRGPNGPIKNWYFHNDPFFPGTDGSGDLMVFDSWDQDGQQIFTININTKAVTTITHSTGSKHLIPSLLQRTREVLYQTEDTIYAVNVDSEKVRKVYVFTGENVGTITTANADGTLLAGIRIPPEQAKIFAKAKNKSDFFFSVYADHPKNEIFLIDLKDESFRTLHSENNWLNHLQFSPTDPHLLLFCREGPWDKVDRIWTLRTNTDILRLLHVRTLENEIAGHEFFSRDGKSVWYDLQTPKNVNFYIASAHTDTGAPFKRYRLENQLAWSYHYAISPDQTWFAGDGNQHSIKNKTGRWIYSYRQVGDELRTDVLVGLRRNNYTLEPNVHISPDGKWVVFGANFEGAPETYAVQVEKRVN